MFMKERVKISYGAKTWPISTLILNVYGQRRLGRDCACSAEHWLFADWIRSIISRSGSHYGCPWYDKTQQSNLSRIFIKREFF